MEDCGSRGESHDGGVAGGDGQICQGMKDLKAELVVAFYADEAQSAAAFVDRCFGAYIVA